LTSLVGQIFSELIIGNLVANKISEPWLLLEMFIILARVADRRSTPDAPGPSSFQTPGEGDHGQGATVPLPARSRTWLSIQQVFWSFIQWGFLAVTSIRLFIATVILSRSLPPRTAPVSVPKLDSTSHYDSEKSYSPPPDAEAQPVSVKVPIVDFSLWHCVANLLEMDVRMPWLTAALSLLQWGAMKGPGRFAGYNGIIDR
jgi:hypothetical protein